MKILAICPTIHPEKLESMINSFDNTRSNYTHLSTNSDGNVTEAINSAFEYHNDYDFYMILNDDLIFKTHEWDLKLANKGKISWGKDGIQNDNLPCFPMIDGDIVRALGCLQMPKLNKYCGDVIWKFIGKECGILNYCPQVIIDHQWHESQVDLDIHKQDMQAFADWLPVAYRDISKVKAVLNG